MKGSDLAMHRLAGDRHGILSRRELLDCGLSASDVGRRCREGVLERVFPSVYRWTAMPMTRYSQWRAATLRGGEGAMLRCRSAGAALGLDGVEEIDKVEIYVRTSTDRKGLAVRRLTDADRPRIVNIRGIPVAATERTLFDLSAVLAPARVGLAIDDALRRRLTTLERLWLHLHHQGGRGRKGSASFRKLLEARDARDPQLRSAFEAQMRRVLKRIRDADAVPNFRVQVGGEVFYLDFFYPAHRLAIECHSLKWHAGQDWLKQDMRRMRALQSVGISVLYFTWDETYFEAERVESEVREALRRRAPQLELGT